MDLNQESILVIITALLAVSEILPHTKLKSNSTAQLIINILEKGKELLSKKEEKTEEKSE